jgi:hypothetical protein
VNECIAAARGGSALLQRQDVASGSSICGDVVVDYKAVRLGEKRAIQSTRGGFAAAVVGAFACLARVALMHRGPRSIF